MKAIRILRTLGGICVFVVAAGPVHAQFYQPLKRPAHLRILLPTENAQLWFGDIPTDQRGACRLFYTPPLLLGKNYSYTLKASWLEDGKVVTAKQQVRVIPGREVLVRFEKQGPKPVSPKRGPPLSPPVAPEPNDDDRPLTPPIAPEPGQTAKSEFQSSPFVRSEVVHRVGASNAR